ncbi:cytochrome c oxidase subunit II [Vreelandella zhaodongensis]|uniref:cytochrome c oxidase subunit II n=1 Tax=Vreelandella zhaodongensis TaxID=1176240 RepID=UPI003EC06DFA
MSERNCARCILAIQRPSRRWVNRALFAIWLAMLVTLAGCAGDKSILDPAGQAARDVRFIWWVMLGFGTLVLIGVTACWLYAFKPRDVVRTPAQERRIARRWIVGGGIILPVASITALLAFGVPAGQRMLPLPISDPPDVIEVIGHQWWFEVRYPQAQGSDQEGNNVVVTANHLVMPVGEPVDFHVSGADVIHGFWIPRLGGKIDMIPGRVNKIRLEADIPAVFGAQCAELCGVGHANMHLYVEAMPREEFDTWLASRQDEQLSEAATADTAHDGAREAFLNHCASCHRVAGVSSGTIGPDLSDIGSRATLGAGVIAMEEGAVSRWLKHHQSLKPGNKMPAHDDLEMDTLDALGAWLETLTP